MATTGNTPDFGRKLRGSPNQPLGPLSAPQHEKTTSSGADFGNEEEHPIHHDTPWSGDGPYDGGRRQRTGQSPPSSSRRNLTKEAMHEDGAPTGRAERRNRTPEERGDGGMDEARPNSDFRLRRSR